MKATDFINTLSHSIDELLALTSEDDTGSELETKLSANGDKHWIAHGAYGIVENCQRVIDNLLSFEKGIKQPTQWQQQYLIPQWERALGLYIGKMQTIDEYYCAAQQDQG
ncbi:hypothetical protein C1752_10481 [Acaryochloris thomasi RCC1774]|uniref:Uncharacterized protein n=1 Tax=Acaryochloris thomasi RCC1774 TaxID=1764569 RepID=A0A2W1JMZ9_9CYAN|nr:hypothetical protein [Acaryochloris thomasi]PZD70631.1 hypothetical protein C1752_10481 [Acaryochloris thomasi RCC1774]